MIHWGFIAWKNNSKWQFGGILNTFVVFLDTKCTFTFRGFWLTVLVIVSNVICSSYIRMTVFITLPYALSLRFKQAEFVREGEMTTNSHLMSWNVKSTNLISKRVTHDSINWYTSRPLRKLYVKASGKCILTVGLFISFIVWPKLSRVDAKWALNSVYIEAILRINVSCIFENCSCFCIPVKVPAKSLKRPIHRCKSTQPRLAM